MSSLSDSRAPNGIGILILQHKDYDKKNFSLDLRGGILAARVLDRDDNAGGLGSWEYDEDSAGDLNGGFLWPKDSRPISGWAFAWPATLTAQLGLVDTPTPSGGGGGGGMQDTPTPSGNPPREFPPVETPSNQSNLPPIFRPPPPPPPRLPDPPMGQTPSGMDNHNKGCRSIKSLIMYPVRQAGMEADGRYQGIIPNFPRLGSDEVWPRFPTGHYGIALTATNEERQIEYFHPTDPRLIAVNFAGDKKAGSLVYDLTPENGYDIERRAPLQSMFWVIKEPEACIDLGQENPIAWNIGWSGCRDVRGGLVIDRAEDLGQGNQDDTPRVIGLVSQFDSGPFDVGGLSDQHGMGADADGHPINPLHISTNAYFRRSVAEDAPLLFEQWRIPIPAPLAVPVHLGLDRELQHPFVCGGREGMWRWWAESYIYVPKEPPKWVPPPTKVPPPVVEKPGGGFLVQPKLPPVVEKPKLPPSGFFPPDVRVKATRVGDPSHKYAAMVNELAVPALLGRPQLIHSGMPDLRNYTSQIPNEYLQTLDQMSPVTFRLESFGKQNNRDLAWTYNQSPLKQKYVGGTSQGGFILLPPEIGMEDSPAFAPAGVTLSTPYFLTHPSAYFGAGLPDVTTGAVKTGYRWGVDTSGALKHDRVDSSGVAINVTQLTQQGAWNWKELGSAPTTPAVGDWAVYFKAAGIFIKDDTGVETGPLGTGGSSPHPLLDGVIANDTIANSPAKGSIIVGDDTKTSFWDVLVVGTDGHVLTADSSEPLGVKWAAAGGGGPKTYEAHTSSDILTAGETGSVHTNEGAVGSVTLTLPSAAAGLEFFFAVAADMSMKVQAAAGDTIRILDGVTSVAGTLTSDATKGETLHLICHNTTEWYAYSGVGTWTPA